MAHAGATTEANGNSTAPESHGSRDFDHRYGHSRKHGLL